MKFSIRDLLLVTVIVALAVGWCVDRARLLSLQRERDDAKHDAWWLATLTNGDDPNGESAALLKSLHEKYSGDLPNSSAAVVNSPSREP